MEKIVVGISGGVDSFAAALLLQLEGYEVIGVNLGLWGINEVAIVEEVCDYLGIRLIRWDGHRLFKEKVVESFIKNYLSGLTPSPCCICNNEVKWELLATAAKEMGIGKIATGHYVKICHIDEKYYILKGKDRAKDQSYFLWGISQAILARTVTPLGNYTKEKIKHWVAERGYGEIARKRESMGICFLEGRNYRDFIMEYVGKELTRPGYIVDRQGNRIGEHSGILHYTVGQKQGIPQVKKQTLYVAAIEACRNEIVVDVKAGLYTDTLIVDQVKAVDRQELFAPDVELKIRGVGLNPEGYVQVEERPAGRLLIKLATPAWAVAPGQPVAFYRKEALIGGGIAGKAES